MSKRNRPCGNDKCVMYDDNMTMNCEYDFMMNESIQDDSDTYFHNCNVYIEDEEEDEFLCSNCNESITDEEQEEHFGYCNECY